MTTLVWFRQDLRAADNPALAHAAARGRIVPVFILDDAAPGRGWPLGSASKWWLHHSLQALATDLGSLLLLRGDPKRVLLRVAQQSGAKAVVWNRRYEPGKLVDDRSIEMALRQQALDVATFNGSLLHEPGDVATGSGGPFKVFSPFWRACLQRPLGTPLARPKLDVVASRPKGDRLEDWALLPKKPNWAAGWEKIWTPGETGALARLDAFLEGGLLGYGALRDRPDLLNVSRLSPHFHWGEISPRLAITRARFAADADETKRRDADKFISEIGWREFACHLLHHFPTLPEQNWKPAFDAYPWRESAADLEAWQHGRTGYPMVDAGMRELWHTGTMHNRVRMIVASFLIKHLRIDWRRGQAWFWDTLVDADLASNSASWQWVAGSGADAAPYFRIFNPLSQGAKFDPNGDYVRRWCPELARLPDTYLHAPFEAPAEILKAAGVVLGKTYPRPIVDHAEAREAALAGYAAVKAATGIAV